MNQITLVRSQFDEALLRLLAQPDAAAVFRVGVSRWVEGVDLLGTTPRILPLRSLLAEPLVRSQARSEAESVVRSQARREAECRLLLSDTPAETLRAVCSQAVCSQARSEAECRLLAFLVLGRGPARGQVGGLLFSPDGRLQPLHRLRLVGPGMHHFRLSPVPLSPCPLVPPAQIWSRTIGALGEAAWQRLIGLRYGLVGCGRSGSLVATALAKLGAGYLTLIDPDCLEPHNLGEMDAVTAADLGKPKVEVLAARLHLVTLSPCHLVTVPSSVTTLRALAALKPCDVLVCCVDNDAARLATALLAAIYLKPLLDIGTGIFYEANTQPSEIRNPKSEIRNRAIGADIRLFLPDDACLLCLGGVADPARARSELLSPSPTHQLTNSPESEAWRRERAGSLRSLNQVAVGFGLRLLEDLVAERLRESVWLRVEFGEDGLPQLRTLHSHRTGRCPVCEEAGRGDDGLAAVTQETLAALPF